MLFLGILFPYVSDAFISMSANDSAPGNVYFCTNIHKTITIIAIFDSFDLSDRYWCITKYTRIPISTENSYKYNIISLLVCKSVFILY